MDRNTFNEAVHMSLQEKKTFDVEFKDGSTVTVELPYKSMQNIQNMIVETGYNDEQVMQVLVDIASKKHAAIQDAVQEADEAPTYQDVFLDQIERYNKNPKSFRDFLKKMLAIRIDGKSPEEVMKDHDEAWEMDLPFHDVEEHVRLEIENKHRFENMCKHLYQHLGLDTAEALMKILKCIHNKYIRETHSLQSALLQEIDAFERDRDAYTREISHMM